MKNALIDVLGVAGLGCIGVGLFLEFGLGMALLIVGTILFGLVLLSVFARRS